jgi:hypothetical protein
MVAEQNSGGGTERSQGEKMFKIDQLLNAHGHTVLGLPPCNCDLSPTELAWAKENATFGIEILGASV